MTTKLTPAEFHKSALPGGFKKEVTNLIELASSAGWDVLINGSSVSIVSPGSQAKQYHFSPKKNSGPLQRIARDIRRLGDPKMVLAMDEKLEDAADAIVASVTRTVTPTPATVAKPRHIVSEGPMLASRGKGDAYKSSTTIERHWSDGSIDYKCARCDFTSIGRLSVSGHWSKHVREDESARSTAQDNYFKAEVPLAAIYAPRQTRIDALVKVLEGLDDLTDLRAIATAALTWVHEQSRAGSSLAAEHEEMTDADILNRIRTLLDTGERAQLHEQNASLTEQVVALTAQVEAAEAKAAKMADSLNALRELIDGLNGE